MCIRRRPVLYKPCFLAYRASSSSIYIMQPFQAKWTGVCLDVTLKVNIVTSSDVVRV